ncbi:MAG: hypothetical protein JWR42_72, partial [Marmoricola sp.]|nr:hypothetical protein [Marmoricola sp.]
PALQSLAVGDVVRLTPEGRPPELAFAVSHLEPPHLLVLGPTSSREEAFAADLPHPCWTFEVDPRGPAGSRLIVRFQCDYRPTPVNRAVYRWGLTPVHLVMELRMMRGIRQRAELLGSIDG